MTSSAVDTQLNNEQRLQFIKASSSNAGLTAECHWRISLTFHTQALTHLSNPHTWHLWFLTAFQKKKRRHILQYNSCGINILLPYLVHSKYPATRYLSQLAGQRALLWVVLNFSVSVWLTRQLFVFNLEAVKFLHHPVPLGSSCYWHHLPDTGGRNAVNLCGVCSWSRVTHLKHQSLTKTMGLGTDVCWHEVLYCGAP